MFYSGGSRSWMPRPSRFAWITTYRLSFLICRSTETCAEFWRGNRSEPSYRERTMPDSATDKVFKDGDQSLIGEIEKAILKSGLGLTPSNDGKIVRINVPPLTEERRKDLIKVVRKMTEEARIAVRNIRREGNESLKVLEKNKEISEDELRKAQDRIQKLTDQHIGKIDAIATKKEKEVLEV